MKTVPEMDLPGHGKFPETRASVLWRIKGGDEVIRARALETIVEVYWKPVYHYIRWRWGESHEGAEDYTQGFFGRAIEREVFGEFQEERARFRTYLRLCLDRFIANERQSRNRLKRGGGTVLIPLDTWEGQNAQLVAEANGSSPAAIFDREWVRSLFSLAIEGLREEYGAQGKHRQFEIFSAYDLNDGADGESPSASYEVIGKRYGISAMTVTNYLAAARRDFRRMVLGKLREITVTEAEFREEATQLFRSD